MPESSSNAPSVAGSAENVDIFAAGLERLTSYRREISVALVVVLGATIIYSIASHMQRKAEMAAANAIYDAEKQAQRNPELLSEKMAAVIEKHKRTRAVAPAMVAQIARLADSGKVDDALKVGESFRKHHDESYFGPHVALSCAQLMMRKGDYAAARKLLQEYKPRVRQSCKYLLPEFQLAEAQCIDAAAEGLKGQEYITQLDLARDAYMTILEADGGSLDSTQLQGMPIRQTAAFAVVTLKDRVAAAKRGDSPAPETPVVPVVETGTAAPTPKVETLPAKPVTVDEGTTPAGKPEATTPVTETPKDKAPEAAKEPTSVESTDKAETSDTK